MTSKATRTPIVLPYAVVLAWRACTVGMWLATAALAVRRSTYPEFFGRYSAPLLIAVIAAAGLAVVLATARRTGLLAATYGARASIGAVAVSLVIGFVLLEIGVRVFDPMGASYFEATRQYELDKVADPLLVYRHPPNTTFEYQGVEVRFNELGLRDRPMRPRSAIKHRVLFLGDSVVFGWGVAEPETMSSELERLLAPAVGGPVGVVNTGVGSYNTVQQERFLNRHGLAMQPDAVLLLYVANDVQVHLQPFDPWTRVSLKDKPPLTALDMLARQSWLVRLFHFMRSNRRLGPPLGGPGSKGWNASLQALQAIRARCEKAGVPLIPMFFRWTPDAEQRLFQDVSKTLHPLTVHDTAQWFAGHPIHELVNSPIDSHPNDRAHQLMAEELAPILAQHLVTAERRQDVRDRDDDAAARAESN